MTDRYGLSPCALTAIRAFGEEHQLTQETAIHVKLPASVLHGALYEVIASKRGCTTCGEAMFGREDVKRPTFICALCASNRCESGVRELNAPSMLFMPTTRLPEYCRHHALEHIECDHHLPVERSKLMEEHGREPIAPRRRAGMDLRCMDGWEGPERPPLSQRCQDQATDSCNICDSLKLHRYCNPHYRTHLTQAHGVVNLAHDAGVPFMGTRTWHRMEGPGVSRCGTYGPNEGLTDDDEHVTCPLCIARSPAPERLNVLPPAALPERPREKILLELKTDLNEFLYRRLPGTMTIDEMETLAVAIHDAIFARWGE